MTFVEIVRKRAAEQPEGRAYTFLEFRPEPSQSHLTYKHLHLRASAIAAQLRSMAREGDCALLLYRPGLDFVCAFLGCLYAGIVAVPVALPRQGQRAERLHNIMADSTASLLLSTSSLKRSIENLIAKDGVKWLSTDEVPDSGYWQQTPTNMQGLAHLQYSSGSTGHPKGIMVTHANLAHQSALLNSASQATSQSCVVSWLPHFHDMGLVASLLQPLFGGFPCVLMSPESFVENPYRWLKAISDFRADVSAAPNFAYEICAARIPSELHVKLDLSCLRFTFTGAEPVRAKTIDQFSETFAPCGFRREAFFPAYGLAEATLMVSGGSRPDGPLNKCFGAEALEQNRVTIVAAEVDSRRRLVGCGAPIPDQKLVIVNPETRLVAEPFEVGEVWVSSPSVAAGYWNNPEATAQTFQARLSGTDEGPFLRTGDLGFVHDGELFLCGRSKDLILIRGRNHHAPDIEFTVESCHPALRHAGTAAFPIQIDEEERLVVVQEIDRKSKTADPQTLEEIIAAIRRGIAEQHDVQVYAVVLVRHGTIPKTSSGKVQRRSCRSLYLEGRLHVRSAWVSPGSIATVMSTEHAAAPGASVAEADGSGAAREMERWLILAVATQLDSDPNKITGRTPITELGLSSDAMLRATRIAEIHLGRPLPATTFLEHANLEALARFLASSGVNAQNAAANSNLQPPLARQPNAEHTDEPIAIVGIGCRFPGAAGPRAFWKMLCEGVDAVTEVPADRWDIDEVYDPNPLAAAKMNTRCGGFIKDIDRLDRKFFGLSVREAVRSDPQHRLMLEVAWEALEDAGISPDDLVRSPTGVFVGISASDYAQMQFSDASMTDAYSGLGCALTIAASRISHFLDLRGPAIAVDTACSSSLSAVHLACNSIRHGECTMALAGGVNVLLSPIVTMCLTKAGMMAADGRCKAFDSRANGYVRSEGAGLVVLKTLSRALADGDPIYAVIRGTASNQDGRSSGISAPNGEAQQAVILAACAAAGISPGQLDYVEAHGTGTAVGDPIEAKALGAVLAIDRPADTFCAIGSVKTNIGHAESAAGVASLIKTALVLKHRQIPPSLHFENPNPLIPFDELPIRVQTSLGLLPERSRPILAGVNGFGVGGTNVHLVLEEAPQREAVANDGEAAARTRPLVLPLSARSPASLAAAAQGMADALCSPDAANQIANICYTAGSRRSHMQHRLAITGTNTSEMAEALTVYLEKGHHPSVASGIVPPQLATKPKLVFAFSGQGSQWLGMGCGLLRSEPVFRRAVEECDALFRPHTGWSLIDELTASPSKSRLDDTEVAQPALFAMQVGLTQLWRSWGVFPDAVVGHSAGEVAAAQAAGALTLPDAAKLIAYRAKLMQQATGGGKMASIELSLDELEPLLASWKDRLSIAAVNGPSSVVLSGETKALESLLESLKPRGAVTVRLPVNYAFHSPQMEPFKRRLTDLLLDAFEPCCVRIPMFSTVTGAWCNGQPLDAHYWGANVRQPVLLANAIDGLAKDGAQIFVEIGPHPVISGAISRNLKAMGVSGTVIPSLRREEAEGKTLMMAVAKLYAAGWPADWKALYPKAEVSQSLPIYHWDRQRFWLDLPDKSVRRQSHPLLGDRLPIAQPVWQKKLDTQSAPFLKDLRIAGQKVVPSGVFKELALAAASELFDAGPYDLLDVEFHAPAPLPAGESSPVFQVTASGETNREFTLSVFSKAAAAGKQANDWLLHLTARAAARSAIEAAVKPLDLETLKNFCGEERSGAGFYQKLEATGTHYDSSLRAVEHVWRGPDAALLKVQISESLLPGWRKFALPPAIGEAATQACRVAYGALGLRLDLSSLQRIRLLRPWTESLYCCAQLRAAVEPGYGIARTDLSICDEAGEVLATFEGGGFTARQGKELVQVPTDPEQWLYDMAWQSTPRDTNRDIDNARGFQGSGNWLILADDAGVGDQLAERLRGEGEHCVLVQHGEEFARLDSECFMARPSQPEDMRRILAEALPGTAWRGIVHLWGTDCATTDAASSDEITAASVVADQSLSSISIVHVIQGVISAELARPPRLWTITRGAQQVDGDSGITGVSQTTVWGLGKVISLEHPELRTCRIDLDALGDTETVQSLFEECWSNSHEDQVALRGSQRYVARLVRHSITPAGDISTRRVPMAGEVEIRVLAGALDDCSGTIVRLGPGVTGFYPGAEVIALSPNCLAPYLTVNANAVFARPDKLSREEAMASVRPFLAAFYALRELAGMRQESSEGEHLFVNGAGTSLANAVVQVAKWLGLTVFASARNQQEREDALRMGVNRVLDDTALSLASELLKLTAGQGVQVILNCTPGWDFSQALPALNEVGHCIELASNSDGSRLHPTRNVSFHSLDLDNLQRARPKYLRQLVHEVIGHLQSGAFTALPLTSAIQFPLHANEAEADTPQTLFRGDATYLITGGLGGLGLSIAKRMVQGGARHLLLLGRRAPSTAAGELLAELRELGAHPITAAVDVADGEQVRNLLSTIRDSMPPLRGIIHAAGVLENGLLAQMDETRFKAVMHSKMAGAWHLHKLTAGTSLDFFVMFSSLAALIGSPGQGNYAAANAFLDGLATHRNALGLPALSIGWGPWAEIGMAADVHNAARLEEAGMGMLPPEKALDLLETLIRTEQGVIGAIAMNWRLWSKAFPIGADAPFVSGLIPGADERGMERAAMLSADMLRQLEPPLQLERLEAAIHKAVCQSLQLDPATLTMDVPLTAVGLDSIVGLELKNRIESAIDVIVQTPSLLRGPTVHELAAQFVSQMLSAAAETPAETTDNAPTPVSSDLSPSDLNLSNLHLSDLDQLSDAEVNSLLLTLAQEA